MTWNITIDAPAIEDLPGIRISKENIETEDELQDAVQEAADAVNEFYESYLSFTRDDDDDESELAAELEAAIAATEGAGVNLDVTPATDEPAEPEDRRVLLFFIPGVAQA
jgi:hypothetical protein